MTQLGRGVVAGNFDGGNGSNLLRDSILGDTIKNLSVDDHALHLELTDGTKVKVFDNYQNCCEYRYLVCDDDLSPYPGAKILSFEVLDGPTTDDGIVHEIQFLRVTTDKGSFTISAHNEHNGYYGGFCLEVVFDI
jgi:hypothetical protein